MSDKDIYSFPLWQWREREAGESLFHVSATHVIAIPSSDAIMKTPYGSAPGDVSLYFYIEPSTGWIIHPSKMASYSSLGIVMWQFNQDFQQAIDNIDLKLPDERPASSRGFRDEDAPAPPGSFGRGHFAARHFVWKCGSYFGVSDQDPRRDCLGVMKSKHGGVVSMQLGVQSLVLGKPTMEAIVRKAIQIDESFRQVS